MGYSNQAMHNPLKEYRRSTGLTQEGLAALLGVKREIVARWEIGARKIGAARLDGVSKLTGIPKRDLRPDLAKMME